MNKHEAPKKRLCVEYKGGELILPPGHKVFELNTKTGEVKEYELIKKFSFKHFLTGKKAKYRVDTSNEDFLHLPASDLYKAKSFYTPSLPSPASIQVHKHLVVSFLFFHSNHY